MTNRYLIMYSMIYLFGSAGVWAQTTAPKTATPARVPASGLVAAPVVPPVEQSAPNKPVELPTSATSSAPTPELVRVLLTPGGETTLASPVAAKVQALNATLGASFARGQTLVSFDCSEPLARLDMAKAELDGATEQHEAKIRMQGLDQASDVEVAMAASAVAKFRAQIALSKAQVQQCTVVAPWAGRVAKLHIKNHMSVTPGQAMLDLVMSAPLKLKVNAPSKRMGQVKVGSLFDVAIDETGKTYKARVSAVNSRVDPVSQTIEIEAGFVGTHSDLLAGMSGTANFALAKK
jgi:membrane fusion protein, multidrug efflux system